MIPDPMDDWPRILPIVVQFGVGAVLCAIGVVAGIRSGYVDLSVAEDRRAVRIVIGGFIALLILFAVFTFWLPNLPAEAAP